MQAEAKSQQKGPRPVLTVLYNTAIQQEAPSTRGASEQQLTAQGLQEQVRTLKAQNSASSQKLVEKQGDCEALQKTVVRQHGELAARDEKIKELQKHVDQLKSDHNQTGLEMYAMNQADQTQVQRTDETNRGLNDENQRLNDHIQGLSDQIRELNEEVQGLNDEAVGRTTENERIFAELQQTRQRAEQAEERVTQIQRSIDELVSASQRGQQENVLRRRIGQLETTLKDRDSADTENRVLRERANRGEREARGAYRELEKELADLRREQGRRTARSQSALVAENKDLKQQLEDCPRNLEESRRQLKECRQQLEECQRQLRERQRTPPRANAPQPVVQSIMNQLSQFIQPQQPATPTRAVAPPGTVPETPQHASGGTSINREVTDTTQVTGTMIGSIPPPEQPRPGGGSTPDPPEPVGSGNGKTPDPPGPVGSGNGKTPDPPGKTGQKEQWNDPAKYTREQLKQCKNKYCDHCTTSFYLLVSVAQPQANFGAS